MSFSDCSYMRRALELAKKARFNCPPNPAVGCVIVKDRRIIGFPRRKCGGRNGLRDAGTVLPLRKNTAVCLSA